ncbi:WD40-repeat-containing domain protein [Protomyces lactucae-debilis]|uniref:WD40-repeat-containing domain protein n=1 Tax=Protomyces lactucae-debilis TaxID=2754530 RepID=A0A1Y2F996_PROLT|nr:WD40-repeat-containing domain protein [Protomyces lactucae-debilis]ORY80502.1 WD40-repeat-containing domain protein [Protomyces lactucae-debilis]
MIYEAEGPINAIDLCSDGTRAAVAGRELLKIVSLNPDGIREEVNLRDAQKVNLNYSSNDVKWGKDVTAKMLAIATTNGSIVIWHAEHESSRRMDRVINGHSRAVNRLSFNPGNGSWLLSASQDGSMKLWDLRDREHGTRFTLKGRAEAVRDVQFNASNALELAAVFDNGTLQKWDLRQPSMYERKLNAHQGLALAVDWHADGRHVATGGRDKVIKVWDIGSSNQRKPVASIHTLAPVSRVAWRPGDVRKSFDIASCSFSMENVVRLWNLRRPYLASRVFETHSAAATGIVWRDDNTLLTCSKDRHIHQHAVYTGAAPVDYLSHYSFSWNGNNDIARQKLVRSDTGPKFDADELAYEPVQSFATIEPEDDQVELFRYLAINYDISSHDPIASCLHNAQVAKRAQQDQIEKSWSLIKLALTQQQRRERHAQVQAKKNSTGSSHIHKDYLAATNYRNLGHFGSFESSTESVQSDAVSTGVMTPMARETEGSGATLKPLATSQPRSSLTPDQADDRPWALKQLATRLLSYYREFGDVQMCSTMTLVLQDKVATEEPLVDEWHYCYLELLQRQRLFVQAAKLIKTTSSAMVRAFAEGDTTIYLSCARCHKQAPLVRERNPSGEDSSVPAAAAEDSMWSCVRCSNTAVCIICQQVIRGHASWCHSCSHASHAACKAALDLDEDMAGYCVAPNCQCKCRGSKYIASVSS